MSKKLVFTAYPMRYNTTAEIQLFHNKNNEIIKQFIDKFRITNGLNTNDFLIVGSSCASYMSYFMLNEVRDVDIFMLNNINCETLVKTDNIDILSRINIPDGYMNRIVEKDGYLFLSKEDLLISMSLSVLLKMKRRNMSYVRLLLIDLDMNVDEFIELLITSITNMTNLDNKYKELAIKNIMIFKIKLTDESIQAQKIVN